MSSAEESRQAKVIDELRVFIKKVLSDPTIAVKSVEIARKYRNQPNANELIAREISANTTIRIPESWSRADHMFLDILDEVWMTKRRFTDLCQACRTPGWCCFNTASAIWSRMVISSWMPSSDDKSRCSFSMSARISFVVNGLANTTRNTMQGK